MNQKKLVIGTAQFKPDGALEADFFTDAKKKLLDVSGLVSRNGNKDTDVSEGATELNEENYQSGAIQGFYDTIDSMGACGDDYIARIDILMLEKTIAVVQVIEDNWHGYKFTDILNLNKINGEWKIVAKVYDTLSKE